MTDTTDVPKAFLGWLGFATGASALILTIVIFWAGPFAPQQSAGVSLGELAADIAKSAARSVAGQPFQLSWNVDRRTATNANERRFPASHSAGSR